MSKTVLITGPIGSGKSAVCARLRALGCPVYDCDSRTKALYDRIPGLKARIEQALGVPFREVGIIFKDPSKRRALEEIVYPEVLKDLAAWKAEQTAEVLFVESAIALEKPEFDGSYDEVWLIRAPFGTRLSRNPETAVRSAIQAMVDPSKATAVIDNDSSLEELYDKVDKLIKNG